MSTIDDGGPACPVIDNEGEPSPGDGMTLRDYFAAAVLAKIFEVCTSYPRTAEEVYKMADAMLAARKGGAA